MLCFLETKTPAQHKSGQFLWHTADCAGSMSKKRRCLCYMSVMYLLNAAPPPPTTTYFLLHWSSMENKESTCVWNDGRRAFIVSRAEQRWPWMKDVHLHSPTVGHCFLCPCFDHLPVFGQFTCFSESYYYGMLRVLSECHNDCLYEKKIFMSKNKGK